MAPCARDRLLPLNQSSTKGVKPPAAAGELSQGKKDSCKMLNFSWETAPESLSPLQTDQTKHPVLPLFLSSLLLCLYLGFVVAVFSPLLHIITPLSSSPKKTRGNWDDKSLFSAGLCWRDFLIDVGLVLSCCGRGSQCSHTSFSWWQAMSLNARPRFRI